VFFGPAFNDNFLLGIELHGIATLPVHHAEKAVFPSTEGKIRHRSGYADVDANVSGGSLVAEAAGG